MVFRHVVASKIQLYHSLALFALFPALSLGKLHKGDISRILWAVTFMGNTFAYRACRRATLRTYRFVVHYLRRKDELTASGVVTVCLVCGGVFDDFLLELLDLNLVEERFYSVKWDRYFAAARWEERLVFHCELKKTFGLINTIDAADAKVAVAMTTWHLDEITGSVAISAGYAVLDAIFVSCEKVVEGGC
jgi:hypothetical protein